MDRAALSTLSLQQLLHLLLTVIHKVCNRLRIASLGLPCGSMRRFKLREGGWGLLPVCSSGLLPLCLWLQTPGTNDFLPFSTWNRLFQFCNLKHSTSVFSLDVCGELQGHSCDDFSTGSFLAKILRCHLVFHWCETIRQLHSAFPPRYLEDH